jgi:rhodanese-related sulfurtransferase
MSESTDTERTGEELEDEIDAEEARALIASGKARSIDIRGPEAAGDGHVPGATIVVDDDVEAAAESALEGTEKPLLVFGDDDGRAREAAEKLRDGGTPASAVKGGLDAWESAGGQLQPGTDEEYEGPTLKQPGN